MCGQVRDNMTERQIALLGSIGLLWVLASTASRIIDKYSYHSKLAQLIQTGSPDIKTIKCSKCECQCHMHLVQCKRQVVNVLYCLANFLEKIYFMQITSSNEKEAKLQAQIILASKADQKDLKKGQSNDRQNRLTFFIFVSTHFRSCDYTSCARFYTPLSK